MLRFYILFILPASLFLGCGSYNEVNSFLAEKCGNDYYNIATQFCYEARIYDKFGGNKGEFIDSRDGKAYKYATIGTQTWMAENLRYETSNTKCYGDNSDNCEIYGILYDWNTANEVCPVGWHLPSDAEWFTLRSSVGSNADSKLIASEGFNALPGGYYRHEGYFLNIEVEAVFWSATAGIYAGSAHVHHITPLSWVREVDGLYINNSWVNVRCVKD